MHHVRSGVLSAERTEGTVQLMTAVREFEIPDGLVGERLDTVVSRLTGLSRSRAAALIDGSAVWIDGVLASKSARVDAGVCVRVDMTVADQVSQRNDSADTAAGVDDSARAPLSVLYLDDDLVVIDKPVGMAAHGSPGWVGPTVTGTLAGQGITLADAGADERQGIVHRLDVGTSGVMAVARSVRAYSSLKRQFKERTVGKTYHAVVQGHPDPASGTIDAPIDRHPTADYRFAVMSGGRPSVTHYDTIDAFRYASLLEVHLETGRTHQIRVHMSAIKHPCVGDTTYGADPVLAARLGLTRQWLHAVRLEFSHPSDDRRMTFSSEYPNDLQNALTLLDEWTNS